MSKQTYVELGCDNCGQGYHATPGSVDAMARSVGWIITKDKNHFCSKECRSAYRFYHKLDKIPTTTEADDV